MDHSGSSARWRWAAVLIALFGLCGAFAPAGVSASTLATGLPPGFTVAAPPTPPPPGVGAPLSPAEESALVAAAVKTYGITEAQAQHDVEAQALAVRIVNKLEDTLGSGYAGVWFDMQAGKFKIDAAPTTDRRGIEQVENYFGIAADSEQVPVTYTWDQLAAAQGNWANRVETLPPGDLATVAINAQENAIVVSTSKTAPSADIASIASEAATENNTTADPPVSVVRSNLTEPPTPTSCSYSYDLSYGQNDAYCDAPLRGGVGIQNNAAGCTTGFLTYVPSLNGGAGGYDIMTAGHCVAGNNSWWSTYQANHSTFRWVGPPARWFQDGRGDVALLNIFGQYFCYSFSGQCNGSNAAGYSAEFDVAQLCGCAYNENVPIYASGASYYNMPACFNGRFSSTHCGYDSDPNTINVTFNGIGHTTYNTACAVHGDSGSAIYAGTTGFGILDSAHICPNPGIYYTEVQPALAEFGLASGDI